MQEITKLKKMNTQNDVKEKHSLKLKWMKIRRFINMIKKLLQIIIHFSDRKHWLIVIVLLNFTEGQL